MHRLRIAGLGHSLPLEVDADTTTVRDLKAMIENQTGLPPPYQRLLARGTQLDNSESEELSLKEAGVKDRTKIMLLHSALYAQEKEGFEALTGLAHEINDLEAKAPTLDPKHVAELVTQLCCRLDEVDTGGSTNLRTKRKALLHQAEQIEQKQQQQQQEESEESINVVNENANDGDDWKIEKN